MQSYKSGQVSAQLFAKPVNTKQNGLASLFAPKPSPKPVLKSSSKTPINLIKNSQSPKNKKSTPSIPKSESPVKQAAEEQSMPYLHETLVGKKSEKVKSPEKPAKKRKLQKDKNDDDDESLRKRPRRDRLRDKRNDNRTIFVGNCPLSADRKVLKSLFREFGDIESIRFRCAPPADPNLPRRAIVITKNFHEQCKNYVAYIVYKEEEAAKKALVRNGHLLDGLHIRVDISTMSKKHDKKRSVFVGNLPFDVTEEDLYSHFEDCGEIKNVRLIRDRRTSLGKGIGYVQFDSKDSVSLALKLNKTKVQGREVRVMVCTNKPDKQGEKVIKKDGSEKKLKVKPKKPTFAPSNVAKASFGDKFKLKREKRLRKIKKKKELAKKSEGLPAVGDDVAKLKKKNKVKKKAVAGNKSSKSGKASVRQKGKKTAGKGKGQKIKQGKQGKRKS
ncbi:RNA-binding protein 34 [Elysia marginata]|uniref:RNA-binding protein 34 n=1 Tax=Elysia marginata TaxID=1093978 RepID=A0AAV4H3W1_9GAST|nr:RNA-binding protein 34 [Elysia marginata]